MAATQEDIAQFRAGMRFKVIDDKEPHKMKHNIPFAYCKTKSQLKTLTRIATRGLNKVMWRKESARNRSNHPAYNHQADEQEPTAFQSASQYHEIRKGRRHLICGNYKLRRGSLRLGDEGR